MAASGERGSENPVQLKEQVKWITALIGTTPAQPPMRLSICLPSMAHEKEGW